MKFLNVFGGGSGSSRSNAPAKGGRSNTPSLRSRLSNAARGAARGVKRLFGR